MSLDRRRFLKLAGLTTLVGLGGTAGWELLRPGALEAAQETPNPGALTARRWGMVIDMQKFTPETAQASIDACNYYHNVPTIDTKQNIKWIWLAPYLNVFPETENPRASEAVETADFITMCNHCDNPPCVRVCPTQATFRREDGIVMMDMHRCIGCRFCMAACPYGSRSFNFMDPRPHIKKEYPRYPTRTRGVVEKCTFCSERLEVGQLPYCVEASGGAMVFGDVDDPGSEVRQILRQRFSIVRKPNLGTHPQVYYLV
ncbi:MAG: 4Fe-4S dicluster domain-containing protein [Deltaproteobacteria bacterium]|nr:4Fe-4S dicluster domain-containing protein [Deltaproteobacteria bacterium]